MSTSADRHAYVRGFRDGLRDIVGSTRYRAAPSRVQKHVGSFGSDADARRDDARAFRSDVQRGKIGR